VQRQVRASQAAGIDAHKQFEGVLPAGFIRRNRD